MALALDGSTGDTGVATTGSGTIVVSLTTTKPNDIIFAGGFGGPTGVTDSAGLTWTEYAEVNPGTYALELWYAIAADVLTNDSISVTFATGWQNAFAFAVSGADTAAPFDTNAAVPALSVSGQTTDLTISTSSTDDFIFAVYSGGSSSTPSVGAPWTTLGSGAQFIYCYQIVSAAQSGLALPSGMTAGYTRSGIGSAVVAAAAANNLAPRGLGTARGRAEMAGVGSIAQRSGAGSWGRMGAVATTPLHWWAARRQRSYLAR